MAPRPPAPDEGMTFTDEYGDYITVAPNGDGKILISVGTPDPNEPDRMVAVPAVDLIPLFTATVKASGRAPEDLRKTAIRQGLVRPRITEPVKPNRQARRAKAREQARSQTTHSLFSKG